MVQFVGVSDIVKLINQVGLETVLRDLADRLEADFKRWPEFEKTPRLASHSRDGVIELMPISDHAHYAFKYVNGHPKNTARGLQTVAAFGVVSDVDTGYTIFVSEMTLLTAVRTAAMSALAARYLARPDSRTMALIGLGAQSEFQAIAFAELVGIEHIRAYDVDEAATAKFVRNMRGRNFSVEVAESAADAVVGADIITTATADKQQATILSENMVGAGVHINAVGGDCPGKTELEAAVLRRSAIFVELTEQTRIEGEIQQLAQDHPVTELWEVITGQVEGRSSRDTVTIFDSVGFAMEDFSALQLIRDIAQQTGHFQDIDLIVEPRDPRDLFGLLTEADAMAEA